MDWKHKGKIWIGKIKVKNVKTYKREKEEERKKEKRQILKFHRQERRKQIMKIKRKKYTHLRKQSKKGLGSKTREEERTEENKDKIMECTKGNTQVRVRKGIKNKGRKKEEYENKGWKRRERDRRR